MKKFMFSFLVACALLSEVNAQHLVVAPLMEKTVAGNQYGTQLLFETKSQWSFGGFYQQSMQPSEGAHSLYTFYGMTVNAPLMKSAKMNFYFNVRSGIVNNYFFVMAPGFETRVKVSKMISVSLVTSVRMANPSAAFKINIKI